MIRHIISGWWMPVLTVCAILGFIATIGFGLYLVYENQHRANKARERETMIRSRNDVQIRYVTYVLCRSEGRTMRECQKIADGIVLPASLTLIQLEAQLGRITDARINELSVGPPGQRVKIIPGKAVIGPRGAQGAAGPQGSMGPQGKPGERGAQGVPGPQGKSGARGPPGPKGAKGDTGAKGSAGTAGKQGPAGKGEPGPAGAAGARGPAGERGPAGVAGERGPAGPQGGQGAAGERGPVGPAGPQGTQGQQGTQGPPGPAGPPGPPGAPGANGLACPNGFTATTLTLNTPGGQKTLYACVRG